MIEKFINNSSEDFLSFLDMDFHMLLENNNYNSIMNTIRNRHKKEIASMLDVTSKKHYLIIWNAFLAKNILKNSINNTSIKSIYNNIYKSILDCSTLAELQALELIIFDSYIHKSLNGLENKSNFIVNNMIKYIHLHIEGYFSLNIMAKEFNNSPSYLGSLFKNVMNISIINYVHQVKVERAKLLLKTTSKSILEISNLLCYCDTSHFSKTFKKITGFSPIQYRNSL